MAAHSTQTLHILLAEDSNFFSKNIAHMLQQQFPMHSLCLARNGHEAIEHLRREAFHVVLMDIEMPLVDGLTATRFIRNEMQLQLPIIGISVHSAEENRVRAQQAGMNIFLLKPFSAVELASHINNLLAPAEN